MTVICATPLYQSGENMRGLKRKNPRKTALSGFSMSGGEGGIRTRFDTPPLLPFVG